MCSRRICNYCHVERLACHVLELPCMMEDLQLLILLPDVQSDLSYIEANITPQDVQEFERRYTRNPLDITLPKFVLDEHVSMARYLAAVGVRDLFNKEEADLTGISGGFACPAPSDDNIRQPEPQKWSAPNIVTKALEEQAAETSLRPQRALISLQLAMPAFR
nr:leukocyte elastase inhibitor-like [Rhipicephalus microplus]